MTRTSLARAVLLLLAAVIWVGVGGCDESRPNAVPPPNDRCASVSTGPEDTPEACSNGCDDDGDGTIDCGDPDCDRVEPCPGSVACDGDPAPENTDEACANGCSDDGDALVDCEDTNCAATTPCRDGADAGPPLLCPGPLQREDDLDACSNGCSDDEDLLVDCLDPDCAGIGPCGGERMRGVRSRDIRFENTDALCDDGLSNDVDDLVDCDDPDCTGRGPCAAEDGGAVDQRQCPGGQIFRTEDEFDRGGCTDGCSNDEDTFVDGCDPDCEGVSPCR